MSDASDHEANVAQDPLSAELIQAELQRIFASRFFRSSELQRKFLQFVVAKSLEGKAFEIKEYSIGAEAFGRGADFDPRVDSVVRVVARRVRERLAEYYAAEGKDASILVKLSAGAYVPSFLSRESMNSGVSASPVFPLQTASSPENHALGTTNAQPQRKKTAKSASAMYWMFGALTIAIALTGWLLYLIFSNSSRPGITKYSELTHDGQGKVIPFGSGTYGELLTDGARVYFSEISGTSIIVTQVAAAGGETTTLQTTQPMVLKDISPDGSKLLATDFYRSSPDLALEILPLPGGAPRLLGNIAGHDGAWSPGGKQIVFAKGSDLYVANEDGSQTHALVHCEGVPFWPRWSHDGKLLRFTVQRSDSSSSLWEASADGENVHRFLGSTDDRGTDCCGSWSPDGESFIFQSQRSGRMGIWLLPRRSSALHESRPILLTDGPLSFSAPVFSKDGKQIFAIAEQRRGELVRCDLERKEFALYLSGISADHVEFSRDQKWIAYSSYPDGVIWRSHTDGTDRLQLSPSGMTAWFPRWSPDGKQIAFVGSQPGHPVKLYLISMNGGQPEVLLPNGASEVDPNWSPDGQSIMFGAVPSATGRGSGKTNIQILNVRTRGLTILPGSDGLSAPRWSPDGHFVVATALSQDVWRVPGVLIYDFNKRKWSEFENDPIDNKAFSADGKYYYFDKYVDNDPAVFRIRMRDRQLEKVVSLKQIRRSQGVMGWWMGLTPDGSPMVLRDTSIQEIYALDFKPR